jgi:acyl-CoA thioester hydrolase
MTNHYNDTIVRVRYAETDRMGVVYYGNFYTWFEIGRVEFLRQAGFRYRDVEEADGCYIVVVESGCRYRSPARFDDEISVRTRLISLRGPVIRFGYELTRVDNSAAVAEGETTHLVCDAHMKPRVLPERYTQILQGMLSK